MLGIMGAMPEEVEDIVQMMTDRIEVNLAMRTFHIGRILNKECVVVFSRWGKVAASITATVLIQHFKVEEILFSGLAGSMRPEIRVGDLVIGRKFYQHDMDARPFMEEFELPLLGIKHIESGQTEIKHADARIRHGLRTGQFLSELSKAQLEKFGIRTPTVWVGDIASGDCFFSDTKEKAALISKLPGLACVEMEGAALAQVAFEHKIPFTVIRTISDAADDHSVLDFTSFVREVARPYTQAVIRSLLT
jgi:adenosylhomocysteine nucleosidase